jgi:hypothetical protein
MRLPWTKTQRAIHYAMAVPEPEQGKRADLLPETTSHGFGIELFSSVRLYRLCHGNG